MRGTTKTTQFANSVSATTRKFHTLIKAAKSVTWQDIELLGIELYDTHAAAHAAYRELLKRCDSRAFQTRLGPSQRYRPVVVGKRVSAEPTEP